MQQTKLHMLLNIAGYATLIGFVVSTVTRNIFRTQRARELGVSDELLTDTSNLYLISSVVESPLHITTGLLCLYAAYYLKQKLKPLSEIFE